MQGFSVNPSMRKAVARFSDDLKSPPSPRALLMIALVVVTSGKNKIASSASGCTRRTRRFRRNLLTPDAARHGTVRPGEECHGMYVPDEECQGIFLSDAAVSGHFPFRRSRVRAFSFQTQPCLPDAAVAS
jgi:hypothetical protein